MDTPDNINQEKDPSADATQPIADATDLNPAADETLPLTEEHPTEEQPVKKDVKHEKRRKMVVIGSISTLLGWIVFIPFSWIPAVLTPWLSMVLTVAGLVLSCIGVRIPAGPRRDLAITSIIASSVLILVFIVFAVIFHILLG